MKKLHRTLILSVLLYLGSLAFGNYVGAANPAAVHCLTSADIAGAGLKCLEGIFDNVLSRLITLIGIGAFIFLIIGGFRYITAGGDQKAIDSAKKTVTYAILGLVGSLVIYFVFQALMGALGLGNFIQFFIPI